MADRSHIPGDRDRDRALRELLLEEVRSTRARSAGRSRVPAARTRTVVVTAVVAVGLVVAGVAVLRLPARTPPASTATASAVPLPTSFDQVRNDRPHLWQADPAYGPEPAAGDELLLNQLATDESPIPLPALDRYRRLVVSVACDEVATYSIDGIRDGKAVVGIGAGACGEGVGYAQVHVSEPLDASRLPDSISVQLSTGGGTFDVLVYGEPRSG